MNEPFLQLGTQKKPVRVTCDTHGRCFERYIYVALDDAQCEQVREMETQESRKYRSTPETASNVHYRECKLRLTSKKCNLHGYRVTINVRPGSLKCRRGRATIDLLADDVVVVRRPW